MFCFKSKKSLERDQDHRKKKKGLEFLPSLFPFKTGNIPAKRVQREHWLCAGLKADNVCVLQMSVIYPKDLKWGQRNHMFHFMQRNTSGRFWKETQVKEFS